MTRRRITALALMIAAIAVLPVLPADAAQHDTTLVSRAGGFGPVGDGTSTARDISADGRYVLFESIATNLDPESDDTWKDVFVRDVVSGTTTFVSRASGASGTPANGASFAGGISSDGRYVAFSSDAPNLHPDDTDVVSDVFVRDLVANTTTLVSLATGGAKGNDESISPAISADGRTVAFSSHATNLDADSNDTVQDVFVRDLAASTTSLVSRATGATGTVGNAVSWLPSISDDGTVIAFNSDATTLGGGSVGTTDVYVRNVNNNTTTLASRTTDTSGPPANDDSFSPAISGNGEVVAFTSSATNLPDAGSSGFDVFVRDLSSGTTLLASRGDGENGARGDGDSDAPYLSTDGRSVAFDSLASNLDAASDAGVRNVFVRDIRQGATTLVSRASGESGVGGSGNSFAAPMSGDARVVAFTSNAENLDPDSDELVTDAFIRQVAAGEPGPLPVLSINNTSTGEGAAAIFDVSLSHASADDVTVNVDTSDGTAVAGSDYSATSVTVTIPAGQTIEEFSVQTTDDSTDEPHESFTVGLSDPQGATLAGGDPEGRAVIVDDDGPPTLSISNVTKKEGRSGATIFSFTLTKSGGTSNNVSVDVDTQDGSAVAGSDYHSLSAPVNFAPDETTETVDVTVNGDKTRERTETFSVVLSNASNAIVGDDTGTGTIQNDDKKKRRR